MAKFESDLQVCDRCNRPAADLTPEGDDMICGPCADELDGLPVCDVCDVRSGVLSRTAEGMVCPECRSTADDRAAWRDADVELDADRDREMEDVPGWNG